jgi:hypothetical protein
MPFKRIDIVPSSNVMAVEYDEAAQTLLITFVRGERQYQYQGVDAKTAEGFTVSGLTAGAYFLSSIKGRFPYQEV